MPSARAIATSVRPRACARSIASAVGAEMATMRRRTEDRGLLDHFERGAAGEHDKAVARRHALAHQRADQLVERIVPADILAQNPDRAVAGAERGGMDGAGLALSV